MASALTVLVVAAVIWLMPAANGAVVQQPVRFSHAIHTKLMTCEFCHQYYPTRDVAGRPALVRCMMCHAYPVTTNPEAEKLQQFAADKREIPWVRLTRLPDFVHFSHQRHVVVGKVECKTCHGGIAQLTAPPTAPLVTIRMQFCLNCHQSRAVELTDRSLQALQADDLSPAVRQALPDFENKRFPTGADLIGALTQAVGAAPAGAERQQILGQVQAAPPVTSDCIGCHR
ncbi:MAG TPA: cytochrome c3 family protein [bacterium]|nr:cytochrome c3 family protein [bacterium]